MVDPIPLPSSPSPRPVIVRAPGRLHLGFLDPSGSIGRRFGSLGMVVAGFETEIELGSAPRDTFLADSIAAQAEIERSAGWLQALREATGLHAPLRLRLVKVLPAHAGLGSGTQLALAIGRAFALWHGLDLSSSRLASWLGRGLRSGVGIAGFDQGGLLVDGGPSAQGAPAALLSRIPVPAQWRVVVVRDLAQHGLSGVAERRAIAALPPLPRSAAAEICHEVLMRILPGAADDEFEAFATGVSRVQEVLGAHFAPAQAGSAFTSPAVGRLVRWIADASTPGAAGGGAMLGGPEARGAGVGQSSWGPTGFAILPSPAHAEAVVRAARVAGLIGSSLEVEIVEPRNHGATVIGPLSDALPPRSSPLAGTTTTHHHC